jgi:hypothetical protein
MEFALHISRLHEKKALNNINKYSRLYFGDDFCEYLQPNEKEFENMLAFASSNKKDLTLLTSPMSQEYLEKLVMLIDKYQCVLHEFNFEVVFNDYGVYYTLSHYNSFKLVCGCVLARFKRDPRQYAIIDQLDSSFTQTNVTGKYIQNLFVDKKINRIDIDWSPYVKINSENSKINYSVITPWIYLTTTRLCRLNEMNLYDSDNRLRIGEECSRMCKNVAVVMKNKSMHRDLIAIGNTQYYRLDVPPPQNDNCFYNRIIERGICLHEG